MEYDEESLSKTILTASCRTSLQEVKQETRDCEPGKQERLLEASTSEARVTMTSRILLPIKCRRDFCGLRTTFQRNLQQNLGFVIDLLMRLFRGAVFHRGGVPKNSPLVLMGRFPSLMGRFPTLMGCFPKCLNGPFSLLKIPGKQPIKERYVERLLTSHGAAIIFEIVISRDARCSRANFLLWILSSLLLPHHLYRLSLTAICKAECHGLLDVLRSLKCGRA